MEPVTTAIVAAIVAGVASGGGKVGESVLTDAYAGLKGMLKRKFGGESEVAKAVDNLEARPDSDGRKETLKEEVEAVGADQDAEVRQAAQGLLDQLKAQPGGEQHIQNAIGSFIAQADRSSTATVNVDRSKE